MLFARNLIGFRKITLIGHLYALGSKLIFYKFYIEICVLIEVEEKGDNYELVRDN